MGVFYVYYTWINPPPKPVAPQTPQEKVNQVEQVPLEKQESPPGSLDSLFLTRLRLETEEQKANDTVLENDDIIATFNAQGGTVTSWKLKKYPLTMEKESPLTDVLGNNGLGDAFILTVGNLEFDQQPLFKASTKENNILVFDWASQELKVQKQYILGNESSPYFMDVAITVTNKGDKDIQLEPKLWVSRVQKIEEKKGGFFSFLNPPNLFSPVYYLDGKLKTKSNWGKLPLKTDLMGRIYWAGITDRYFLAGLISRQDSEQNVVSYGKAKAARIYSSLSYGPVFLKPGQTATTNYSAYIGPKKRGELQKVGFHLESSVDYGFFSILAIPILYLLTFFQKIVVNWGLAIIVLTIFVKLLLHPVNKKSMNSMKAMQKLQPRLKEIREKFKDDRQRLNMEMMNLFKSHKVNPMSGCLPMILQMPVYIALYKVLWSSVDLYQTPFFWFYKDLSAPDPYFITPILLGVFMALQQKFMPQATTMEPAQQKMMMIMPLMFSVFMLFLPFGLVLYILVNTVMSVVQQYMVHHEMSFVGLMKKGIGKMGLSS